MRQRAIRLVSALAVVVLSVGLFLGSPAADATSRRPRPTTTTVPATTTTTVPATTTTTTAVPASTTTSTTTRPVVTSTSTAVVTVARCVVRLHGKGGDGFATYDAGGWLEVGPQGNMVGWGAYQWMYFPEASYAAVVATVANAITANGCTKVVVDGFSNGAAAAAKLACRNATFGGRVVAYVIDDPVPDHGTDGCARTVPAVLYWTGALAGTAIPGWQCASGDWTCEGGETIGITLAAGHLGLAVKPSIFTGHSPYTNPPEIAAWLG